MASSSSSSSPEISNATYNQSFDRFSYKYATQDEVLEDLSRYSYLLFHRPLRVLSTFWPCSRFILNLPDEELTSVERICFQVEQASALSILSTHSPSLTHDVYIQSLVLWRLHSRRESQVSLAPFEEILCYAIPSMPVTQPVECWSWASIHNFYAVQNPGSGLWCYHAQQYLGQGKSISGHRVEQSSINFLLNSAYSLKGGSLHLAGVFLRVKSTKLKSRICVPSERFALVVCVPVLRWRFDLGSWRDGIWYQ